MSAERRAGPALLGTPAAAGLLLLALAAPPALGASAAADSMRLGDTGLVVSARTSWPARLSKGWFPLRVTVENEGEEPATLELVAEGGYRAERRVRREVRAEQGATQELELLLPISTYDTSYYRLEVTVDGSREEHRLSDNFGGPGSSYREARAVLVVATRRPEQGSAERWGERLSDGLPALGTTGGLGAVSWWHHGTRGEPAVSVGVATFAELSGRHEAYSSLDLVVLDAGGALPAERELDALLAWVRLGGTLVAHGEAVAERLRAAAAVRPYLDERFEEAPPGPAARAFGVGLGRLVLFEERSTESLLGAEGRALVQEELRDPTPALVPGPNHPWVLGTEEPFPIPGVGDLPYRAFALLLVLFAVVIGPVNFVLVKRRGRPGLLLLTIPGIALLASLGFLGYGVLHQGLDVKLVSRSLTFLDQRTHRAATVEERAVFAGMSPGAGLLPSAGTACFPLRLSHGDWGDELLFRVDATSGEVLAGEYLPVRKTSHQVQLSERASRLRLGLARDGGGLRAENALDARVEELLVRAADGGWHSAPAALEPGATAALAPLDDFSGRTGAERLLALRRELPVHLADGALPPGAYVARLASSPFADACGVETTRTDDVHLLVGLLDGESP